MFLKNGTNKRDLQFVAEISPVKRGSLVNSVVWRVEQNKAHLATLKDVVRSTRR